MENLNSVNRGGILMSKGIKYIHLIDGISNFDLGDPWSNRVTKEFE